MAAGVVVALLAAAGLLGGCSTLGYYAQAVGGHLDIVARAKPVEDWLADPATPAPLRERLQLSQRLRDFAVSELLLPDNRSYRRYADLGREAVVWNLVAAPELGLALKTWCYPVAGCVGYRGTYRREPAEALAAELRAQGWETHVYGVPAYSTLGKTDWLGGDPLLNTFIQWSEPELARLLFHELAHQVAYADDDTEFNESFATAVERIGLRRWQAGPGAAAVAAAGPAAQAAQARRERYRDDFRALTRRTREALAALYAGPLPEADKRALKAELLAAFRADHAALKAGPWAGYGGYDAWVANANNAAFGVQAAYDGLVPAFERLYEREGGDLRRFYAAVRALAALPKDRRRATLAALSPDPPRSP